jgi:hypothetical protein
MAHTSPDGLAGTLLVSRMDSSGRLLWTADTGLDRFALRQILPGREIMAFVGARPPNPGMPSEALAVLVHTSNGQVLTHTLAR